MVSWRRIRAYNWVDGRLRYAAIYIRTPDEFFAPEGTSDAGGDIPWAEQHPPRNLIAFNSCAKRCLGDRLGIGRHGTPQSEIGAEALEQQVSLGEDTQFEIKEAFVARGQVSRPHPERIANEPASFANAHGGLVFSVSDAVDAEVILPISAEVKVPS